MSQYRLLSPLLKGGGQFSSKKARHGSFAGTRVHCPLRQGRAAPGCLQNRLAQRAQALVPRQGNTQRLGAGMGDLMQCEGHQGIITHTGGGGLQRPNQLSHQTRHDQHPTTSPTRWCGAGVEVHRAQFGGFEHRDGVASVWRNPDRPRGRQDEGGLSLQVVGGDLNQALRAIRQLGPRVAVGFKVGIDGEGAGATAHRALHGGGNRVGVANGLGGEGMAAFHKAKEGLALAGFR